VGYVEPLQRIALLTAPAIQQALSELQLPPASTGLDVGCGAGGTLVWLARVLGPGASLVGLDHCGAHLAASRAVLREAGLDQRVRLNRGDLHRLP
jgi:ubiquinone/menaquinone biosynthesis C-methylase UbiE